MEPTAGWVEAFTKTMEALGSAMAEVEAKVIGAGVTAKDDGEHGVVRELRAGGGNVKLLVIWDGVATAATWVHAEDVTFDGE